jgi:outer membrane protein
LERIKYFLAWIAKTSAEWQFLRVREEATLGARTTLDVLDAEQELLDAKANKLRAEAQRYVGVYSLLSAMGLLTADHLQLGIVTYDPAAYYNVVKDAPVHSNQGAALDRILKRLGE